MSRRLAFAEGIGAGVGLVLLAGALTAACRPDLVATWAMRGLRAQDERTLKKRDRARRAIQLSPDYLDQCRAAGL